MSGLFDGTFARGGAAAAVPDGAWFRALLEAVAPDVGEAGARVDAVLAGHHRLTEGTA